MSFLEPQPALYAYIFASGFLYVPVITLLALLRASVARGPSRWAAYGAMALGLGAMFLQFGPAFLALYEGPIPVFAGWATRFGGGLVLPLLPSVMLGVSAFVQGMRWRWIDWLHALAALGLIGLYIYIQLT